MYDILLFVFLRLWYWMIESWSVECSFFCACDPLILSPFVTLPHVHEL